MLDILEKMTRESIERETILKDVQLKALEKQIDSQDVYKRQQLCRIRGGYLFLILMLLSSFLVSICLIGISPVSYTHLDVYKRQPLYHL